jgi:hypothetical protein
MPQDARRMTSTPLSFYTLTAHWKDSLMDGIHGAGCPKNSLRCVQFTRVPNMFSTRWSSLDGMWELRLLTWGFTSWCGNAVSLYQDAVRRYPAEAQWCAIGGPSCQICGHSTTGPGRSGERKSLREGSPVSQAWVAVNERVCCISDQGPLWKNGPNPRKHIMADQTQYNLQKTAANEFKRNKLQPQISQLNTF